jgi:hypothetical protein
LHQDLSLQHLLLLVPLDQQQSRQLARRLGIFLPQMVLAE